MSNTREFWEHLAFGTALLATVLAVLAVATFQSYIPAGWVLNLTPLELGFLSFLSAVVAVSAYLQGDRRSY